MRSRPGGIISSVIAFFNELIAKPWPLVRIGIWFVVFLALIGWWAAPAPFRVPTSNNVVVRSKVAGHFNPDGIIEYTHMDPTTEFKVYWVGGSSLRLAYPDGRALNSLDRFVAYYLPKPGQTRTVVMTYQMDAARLYDAYICVLDALRHKPDLLVITVNAFWFFCNKAISFHDNIHPDAVLLHATAKSLLLHALLAKPSAQLAGLAQSVLPGVADRYLKIQKAIDQYCYGLKNISETPNIRQPLYFWAENELGGAPGQSELQRQILVNYFDTGPQSLRMTIFGMMADAVAKAGVPTIWYIAPVRPDAFADPDMAARIQSVRQVLSRTLGTPEHAETSYFLPLNPGHGIPSDRFMDYIHPKDPGPAFLKKFLHAFTAIHSKVTGRASAKNEQVEK